MERLKIEGRWFVDGQNRKKLLRGVNLGGSTKMPFQPDGATHIPTDYHDHCTVSFIGRPFPLAEADEHFRRLKSWGFNCLRFLTTWEAIEHAGPGEYDEAYLDYLFEVVRKAGDHGFSIFIDPHQDVWSRMSGGDGAPGWTLELAGFDLTKLDASEAAITMAGRHPDYGKMIWPTNALRLASATMFTLFFAGERFAPQVRVGDEGIQSYLQRHFIDAMRQVASRLVGLPHVLGYDSLNEPSPGYIGIADLSKPVIARVTGPQFTPFQEMFIPAGIPCEVPWVDYQSVTTAQTKTVRLNPGAVSAWTDPAKDVWRQAGVWDLDHKGQPVLLQPDYFAGFRFYADFVRPFVNQYARAIHAVDGNAIFFIEGEPGSYEPVHMDEQLPVVNASHWYDVSTLNFKVYNPELAQEWGSYNVVKGKEAIRQMYADHIRRFVAMSAEHLNGAPTLIGEFGLPFDLEDGKAYRTNDFSPHIQALSAYYDAMDANLAHCTIWNYTADNNNRWGDRWNQEDLSIFSRDQQSDPQDINSGGRAVSGFCRPFVVACAGTPLSQRFDQSTGRYDLEIEAATAAEGPTIVFVPDIQYPHGIEVDVSAGAVTLLSDRQELEWTHPNAGCFTLTIHRRGNL